jgi:hypothetical protein
MFIDVSKAPAYSPRTRDDSTHISSCAEWTGLCVYLHTWAVKWRRHRRSRELVAPLNVILELQGLAKQEYLEDTEQAAQHCIF